MTTTMKNKDITIHTQENLLHMLVIKSIHAESISNDFINSIDYIKNIIENNKHAGKMEYDKACFEQYSYLVRKLFVYEDTLSILMSFQINDSGFDFFLKLNSTIDTVEKEYCYRVNLINDLMQQLKPLVKIDSTYVNKEDLEQIFNDTREKKYFTEIPVTKSVKT